MEVETNSILAGYRWAKGWPHVAKMLEVIDNPKFCEGSGKLFETCQPVWCMPCLPVLNLSSSAQY